jgi:hypothetical protein
MNFSDLRELWIPAITRLYGSAGADTEDGWSNYILLDKALGITEYRQFYHRSALLDYPIAEDLKKLLVMLAGPHGKSILKAYRIQKGLEK